MNVWMNEWINEKINKKATVTRNKETKNNKTNKTCERGNEEMQVGQTDKKEMTKIRAFPG